MTQNMDGEQSGHHYDKISSLRQDRDIDIVLGMGPKDTRRILDLGCGTGTLLQRATYIFPRLERIVGVDVLPDRIASAREKLGNIQDKVELHTADIRRMFPVTGKFDFVVMTSALHWLYPSEDHVFRLIAGTLAPGGVFALSTYHPKIERDNCGGSDLLVWDALKAMGWNRSAIRGIFSSNNFLPISRLTRPASEIKKMLNNYFIIDSVKDRAATMRVENASQYKSYHTATFGNHYLSLLPETQVSSFLESLGKVAMERMSSQGYVTNIRVRAWYCLPNRG